jgi:aspartyl-tRNA(Asn)/glutamyl-tRNA(Gln) amidotransferase subunit B
VTTEIVPGWELVVGLEVHCELATATKLFCSCPNRFGAEPNTNVCPVCLGLPGSLPVLNGTAVEYAMLLGRALGCTVEPAVFARKNYFYPDMPKDYQVTQYDLPTNRDGHLDLPDGTRVGIVRAHIEEDTGKNTHVGGDGRIHGSDYSLIDYNRAGVPLVEIVSGPDLRMVDQAKAYVEELRGILVAIGVSDARMEEGSMRVDANVSVRPTGADELRTRCEIKNINSVRSLGRAIDYEARRHVDLYTAGESPLQETRHWDEANGRTRPGRSKEDAEDYRYFPEPDLLPLEPTADDLARIDATLPPLPAARRAALAAAAGTGPAAPEVTVVVGRDQDALALAAVAAGADGATVLKHLVNNLAGGTGALDAAGFATLVGMERAGELSATQAKAVLAGLVETGGNPREVAAGLGFEAMAAGELDGLVDQLIADHPDEWGRLCAGDAKLAGFFVGAVMKATRGQADGKVVTSLLHQRAGR